MHQDETTYQIFQSEYYLIYGTVLSFNKELNNTLTCR